VSCSLVALITGIGFASLILVEVSNTRKLEEIQDWLYGTGDPE
jgi:hypothetical protein